MLTEPSVMRKCRHCGKSAFLTGPPPERLPHVRCPHCSTRFWFCETKKVEQIPLCFQLPDNADALMDLIDCCLEANKPAPEWLLQEIEDTCSEWDDD
jgi:hypothetical protein